MTPLEEWRPFTIVHFLAEVMYVSNSQRSLLDFWRLILSYLIRLEVCCVCHLVCYWLCMIYCVFLFFCRLKIVKDFLKRFSNQIIVIDSIFNSKMMCIFAHYRLKVETFFLLFRFIDFLHGLKIFCVFLLERKFTIITVNFQKCNYRILLIVTS